MICLFLLLLSTSTAVLALPPDESLDAELRFEAGAQEGRPRGWGGGPPDTLFLDQEIRHAGSASGRIERSETSSGGFSSFTKTLPVDFGGEVVELRGHLRTQEVSDYAGLWLRLDGVGGSLGFANLRDAAPAGTTDWQAYRVQLPLDPDARAVYFGFLVAGTGVAWGDDLELLVDGKPVWEAPAAAREPTVLDTDTEFTTGSGVAEQTLSDFRVESAALLGEIWGFLKYHHPRIAAGELHWDFELFRALPSVLEAETLEERNRALAAWTTRLGEPAGCDPCAELPGDLHLVPDHSWIDERDLGPRLGGYLRRVLERRFAASGDDSHFYVGFAPNVGNPVFEHELAYLDHSAPDLGDRLLALFRLWNVVAYWFPYRDQIDGDWRQTLRDFVPRLAAASDRDAYRLQMLAFIARIEDTHANLWGALDVRPPRGDCLLPVQFRFVGEVAVVDSVYPGHETVLRRGDVLEAIAGESIPELVARWSPYYAASNQPTRLRDIGRSLGRGSCGPVKLRVRRGDDALELEPSRIATAPLFPERDRPGDTYQRLSPEIAYLKLSSIRVSDVTGFLAEAKGAAGLVVDIRNYPAEFVVFALGGRLVDEPTEFARFTLGDPANPGAFRWGPTVSLQPLEPGYDGKVAILVDETSLSQAEYTAMALRASPRAIVVGSTTAGADGNVSAISLPGGLRTMISGIGVFYPDRTPTQRIGIVPDVWAEPTIEGIRDGRDEVLEVAIREILGPGADEAEVRRLAARP